MDIFRKIFRIVSLNDSGLVLQQGINSQTAIALGYVPVALILLLLMGRNVPLIGDHAFIHALVTILYCVLFIPNYLMPYVKYFKIDINTQKIIYTEEFLFQSFSPQKPWLWLQPLAKTYRFKIAEIRFIEIKGYNQIQLLDQQKNPVIPAFLFQDIYEMSRSVVRMYPLLDVEVLVKPWEGNFANSYTYFKRKLKDANIPFSNATQKQR